MYIAFDHINCIGDMNYDLLKTDKCRPLINKCDNFNLENIIKNPTCCKEHHAPTLIDVILTNSKNLHSFNALIIPILRGCLQSLFNIPVP